MIAVKNSQSITLAWSVYKGASDILEDFSRALLKIFLLSSTDMIPVDYSVEEGVLQIAVPTGLPVDAYDIEAVWLKNKARSSTGDINGECLCRSRINEIFAITDTESEVTNSGSIKLKLTSRVATYGYDGLNAYYYCVLTGAWKTSFLEWRDSKLGQLVTENEIAENAVTLNKLAADVEAHYAKQTDLDSTNANLTAEAKERLEEDQALQDSLDKEITTREELSEQVAKEIKDRTTKDSAQDDEIVSINKNIREFGSYVNEQLTIRPTVDATTEGDYEICDEAGNVILRCKDGHIQVKKFNSSKAVLASDTTEGDYEICDEAGNVIFRIKDGNIKTKTFDSSNIKGGLSTEAAAALIDLLEKGVYTEDVTEALADLKKKLEL